MKSDIEIARSIELKKIKQVAESVDIPRDEVENYGRYIAKIPTHLIDEEKVKKSNLILVTAITATKVHRAGIGAEQDWQESDCGFTRTLVRSLLRHERRCCRWRICPGAAHGEDKPALYGRLSRHYLRTQHDFRFARQLLVPASGGWLRTERNHLAART